LTLEKACRVWCAGHRKHIGLCVMSDFRHQVADNRTALFWVIPQSVVVIACRLLGSPEERSSHFGFYSCLMHQFPLRCLFTLQCILRVLRSVLSTVCTYSITIIYCKLSPCSECCILSFGWFPGVWNFICRNFGSFCSIFIGGAYTAYEDRADSVFRNVAIKFIPREIT
jgi:hypothetical protein